MDERAGLITNTVEVMTILAADVSSAGWLSQSSGLPYIVRHSTHDLFLGAVGTLTGCAGLRMFKADISPQQGLVLAAGLSLATLFAAETGQGILQLLGLIRGGFAWEDYLAYTVGVLGASLLELSYLGLVNLRAQAN